MKKYINMDGIQLKEGMRVEGLINYNTPYGGNFAPMEGTLIKNKSGKTLVFKRDDGFIYSLIAQENYLPELGETRYPLTILEVEVSNGNEY